MKVICINKFLQNNVSKSSHSYDFPSEKQDCFIPQFSIKTRLKKRRTSRTRPNKKPDDASADLALYSRPKLAVTLSTTFVTPSQRPFGIYESLSIIRFFVAFVLRETRAPAERRDFNSHRFGLFFRVQLYRALLARPVSSYGDFNRALAKPKAAARRSIGSCWWLFAHIRRQE